MKPESEMVTNKSDLAEKGIDTNPEMCKCPECGCEGPMSEFTKETEDEGEDVEMEKEKPTPGKLALQIIMAKGKK